MHRITLSILLALVGLISLLLLVSGVKGQGTNPGVVVTSQVQGENVREVTVPDTVELNAPQQPNIGFIDSPSVTCYQPDPAQDVCYINWYYQSVDASPNYMVTMTTFIKSQMVSNVGGFFQTSMYVPYNMFGQGFKVACGALGAGGNDQLGNAYSYTVRARDSSNLKSANYGTVYCPAYIP